MTFTTLYNVRHLQFDQVTCIQSADFADLHLSCSSNVSEGRTGDYYYRTKWIGPRVWHIVSRCKLPTLLVHSQLPVIGLSAYVVSKEQASGGRCKAETRKWTWRLKYPPDVPFNTYCWTDPPQHPLDPCDIVLPATNKSPL